MDYIHQKEMQSCLLMIDDVAVELPLRRSVCAAIRHQAHSGVDFRVKDPFEKISDTLNQSLDSKYVPPSEAQVNYVFVIAGVLNIPVAPEVVASKASCHAFISSHVDDFRASFPKTDS